MDAAKKIFSAKGFNRSTMEEIDSEAELSPGTLYLYFKNKEELHTSLSIDILQYLTDKIKEFVYRKDMNAGEKLTALKDAFIDVYEYEPMVLINLFHLQAGETLKNLSGELFELLKTTSADALGAITLVTEEGIEQGLFVKNILLHWQISSGRLIQVLCYGLTVKDFSTMKRIL